eukprot:5278562-Prymnesium_polylepis.1
MLPVEAPAHRPHVPLALLDPARARARRIRRPHAARLNGEQQLLARERLDDPLGAIGVDDSRVDDAAVHVDQPDGARRAIL